MNKENYMAENKVELKGTEGSVIKLSRPLGIQHVVLRDPLDFKVISFMTF